MKRVLLLCLLILPACGFARLFFVGSNPYFSIIAFPQDLLFFKQDTISYSFSYQLLPWWGDVDEPTKKPNDSYTATGQSVSFVREAGDTQDSYFKQYSSINIINNRLDYFHAWDDGLKSRFSLIYQISDMESTTEGNLKVETNTTYYIPVHYSLSHLLNKLYLESILAFRMREIPVGIKLGAGFENTGNLTSSFNATVQGQNISSSRMLWGWATVACNHIFGVRGINGDAWLQSDYSTGPLYTFDLQVGATLDPHKVGARVRYITGLQDQYVWVASNTNTVINENFRGSYEKQKWSKKIDDNLYRGYANWNFIKSEAFLFNVLFFAQLDNLEKHNTYSDNPAFDSGSVEQAFSLTFEANPNVTVSFGHGFNMDAALLLEYSTTRYENRYNRWNSLLGGNTTAYWNSYYYQGDEYSWEGFSYADENFFDAGLDILFNVPLFKGDDNMLALGLILFENTKFTFKRKAFGINTDTATNTRFTESGLRDNFKREIWFNSTISLLYKWDRTTLRLDVIEPLVYSLFFSTKVSDSNGNVLYDTSKESQWAVQEGLKINLSISYDL